MDDRLISDIVEWDCINWARAIQFWDESPLGNFMDMHCYGFWGILGQGKLWDISSRLDRIIDSFLPAASKYIVSCVAKK